MQFTKDKIPAFILMEVLLSLSLGQEVHCLTMQTSGFSIWFNMYSSKAKEKKQSKLNMPFFVNVFDKLNLISSLF